MNELMNVLETALRPYVAGLRGLVLAGALCTGVGVQAQSATTTTLTSSANPMTAGQTTLTANVIGASPTGSVIFASDAKYANRIAYLRFQGPNASTTITGSEATPKIWTPVGNAKLSNTAGVSSLALDGSGSYVTTTSNLSDFVFGTGDFEIRFRMKSATAGSVPVDFYGGGSAIGWQIYITASGKLQWYDYALRKTGTITVTDGAWHDIEVSRTGGILNFYVDGTRDGSGIAYSVNLSQQMSQFTVGTQIFGRTGTTNDFNGLLGAVRISKGLGGNTAATRVVSADGSVVAGSAAVSSGVAAINVGTPAPGQYYWASYSGDAGNAPSISPSLGQPIRPLAATATTLVSSTNPAIAGQNLTLTANVSGASPTGGVSFASDLNHAKRMADLRFEGPDASTVITGIEATPKTWTAVGSAKLSNTAGISSLALDGSGSYVSTVSNRQDFVFGTGDFEIRFRMKSVTPGKVILDFYFSWAAPGWQAYINPAGKLGWTDTAASKTGAITVSDGAWHDIEISRTAGVLYFYVDGTRDGPGTAYTVNLSQAPPAFTIGTQNIGRTDTTNDFIGLLDDVRISKGIGGNIGATRVVSNDGTVALGSAAVSGGSATVAASVLPPGQYKIYATYGGDAANAASMSADLSQTIKAQASVALAMTPSPAIPGQTVTLTATITGSSPTGTVTFKDGSTTLATVASAVGVANYLFGPLIPGSYSFTAIYPGDAANVGASSAAISQAAVAQTTTTLVVSPSIATLDQNVTLSARVQGSNPSGTVTFTDGGTTVGAAALVGGVASYSSNSLALGSHSLAATYTGDGNNTTSSAAAVSVTVNAASGMVWKYGYDAMGRLNTTVDPNGLASSIYYDTLGRPIQTQQPPNTGSSTPTVITLGYNLADNLTSVADPRNLATTYVPDGLGNVTAQSSPDTAASTFTYDTKGNLLTSVDARGKQTTYGYDSLDRLSRIGYPTGTGTTFEYDGGTSQIPVEKGKLTRMADESGQTGYVHDALGRLTTKTVTIGSRTFTTGYSWGESGAALDKLTAITYPSGSRVNYSYDLQGFVSTISVNPVNANGAGVSGTSQALLGTIGYNADNSVTGWLWSDGKARTIGYDSVGQIASYTLGDPLGTGTSAGSLRSVARDSAGRITGYSHTNNGAAQSALDQGFSYDNLNRLTTASLAASNTVYSYDENGNRKTKTVGGTTYTNTVATTSNRLTQTQDVGGTASPTYDAAGHVTGDGTNTYTYNDRGRMTSAANAGGTVSYVYNGLNQRAGKSGPGALVPTGAGYFLYDEQGQLLGEYDASGAPVYETIYLGTMPVGVLKQTGTAAANNIAVTVYNVNADHIATPRLITRQDHTIVWRWDTAEAFGATAPDQNPSSLGGFAFNQRFPGQVFDQETGLFQNWNREYNARLGRYTQSDPIGLKGGINTFAYVESRPTMLTDPQGLWSYDIGFPVWGKWFSSWSFGYDETARRHWLSGQFGWGSGAGYTYDPDGGLPPGIARVACDDNVFLGVYTKIGASGGLKGVGASFDVLTAAWGVGMNSGAEYRKADFFEGPSYGNKTGAKAEASMGMQLTLLGRQKSPDQCTCPSNIARR